MNELERQIRELSLRQPGDAMDDRLFSLLRSSGDNAPREQSSPKHVSTGIMDVCTSKAVLANETAQTRRGIFPATFASLTTALLIGIAVGNAMPALWSDSRGSTAGRGSSDSVDSASVPPNEVGSEVSSRHPMLPDLPAHVRNALTNPSTTGSQFVESSYQSAVTGAVFWEQQNGEVFSVATHVSDRRFDMCRDCHRVGG